MPSLCSYDQGKRQMEGRRYKADVEAVKEGMTRFLAPIRDLQARQKRNKEKVYRPRMVMTLGNHEERINKAVDNDAKLEGVIGIADLGYEQAGWEVHPFLEVVVIQGVAFSHYYPSGQMGRPITSARALLNKMHMSCIAGHQQGRDIAYGRRADGTSITAIIAGSCYTHDEDYLSPLNNQVWRGIVVLNEVENGSFDEMMVSLKYLEQRVS